MHTKLTLRLDEELIRKAKRFSEEAGKSVSQLVADYFALLEERPEARPAELTPKVRSLLGALADGGVDESDYARHVDEKHK